MVKVKLRKNFCQNLQLLQKNNKKSAISLFKICHIVYVCLFVCLFVSILLINYYTGRIWTKLGIDLPLDPAGMQMSCSKFVSTDALHDLGFCSPRLDTLL